MMVLRAVGVFIGDHERECWFSSLLKGITDGAAVWYESSLCAPTSELVLFSRSSNRNYDLMVR